MYMYGECSPGYSDLFELPSLDEQVTMSEKDLAGGCRTRMLSIHTSFFVATNCIHKIIFITKYFMHWFITRLIWRNNLAISAQKYLHTSDDCNKEQAAYILMNQVMYLWATDTNGARNWNQRGQQQISTFSLSCFLVVERRHPASNCLP